MIQILSIPHFIAIAIWRDINIYIKSTVSRYYQKAEL